MKIFVQFCIHPDHNKIKELPGLCYCQITEGMAAILLKLRVHISQFVQPESSTQNNDRDAQRSHRLHHSSSHLETQNMFSGSGGDKKMT